MTRNIKSRKAIVGLLLLAAVIAGGYYFLTSNSHIVSKIEAKQGADETNRHDAANVLTTRSYTPSPTVRVSGALPKSGAAQLAQEDTQGSLKAARDCLGAALVLDDLVSAESRCNAAGDANCSDLNVLYSYSQYSKEKAEWANDQISGCPTTSDEILSRQYFDALVISAKAGDVAAQACYVEGNFGVTLTPADDAAYVHDGVEYVNYAFARGDWAFVDMLMSSLSGASHNHQIYALMENNGSLDRGPAYYRLNRLMRLGATGNFAAQLDALGEVPYERPDPTMNPGGSPVLSAEQVAEAKAWAAQVYAKYFGNSPKIDRQPDSECVRPVRPD